MVEGTSKRAQDDIGDFSGRYSTQDARHLGSCSMLVPSVLVSSLTAEGLGSGDLEALSPKYPKP